jgi:hypothetical protein
MYVKRLASLLYDLQVSNVYIKVISRASCLESRLLLFNYSYTISTLLFLAKRISPYTEFCRAKLYTLYTLPKPY